MLRIYENINDCYDPVQTSIRTAKLIIIKSAVLALQVGVFDYK